MSGLGIAAAAAQLFIISLHYKDGSRGNWMSHDETEFRTMLDRLKAGFGRKVNVEFGTLDDLTKPYGMVRMDELLSFEGRKVDQGLLAAQTPVNAGQAEAMRKLAAETPPAPPTPKEDNSESLGGDSQGVKVEGANAALPTPDTGPSTKTGFNPAPPVQTGVKSTATAKAVGAR